MRVIPVAVLIVILFVWVFPVYSEGGDIMLRSGNDAPEFSANTYDGKSVSLSKVRGEGPVVLVFLRGFG